MYGSNNEEIAGIYHFELDPSADEAIYPTAYGVYDANYHNNADDDGAVVVPETSLNLTNEQADTIACISRDHGQGEQNCIASYLECLQHLQSWGFNI